MITCPNCHTQFEQDCNFCGNCGKPIPESVRQAATVQQHDTFIGKWLDRKYYIQSRIAEGGMGIVYLAIQRGVGQKVAIKKLHASFYENETIVKRFYDEARSYAKISHPNAVKLYDLFKVKGQLCIVMEYVDGRTLTEYIDKQYEFSNRQIIDICIQLADALGAIHRAGIIHRDLKSDNVMLVETTSKRFSVKILDFGIAKIVDQPAASQTQTGIIVGTPEYMAPEQCYGQSVDHRVDIYAFGVLMYLIVCGHLPFMSESAVALMQMQVSEPVPPPIKRDGSEVHPRFAEIISKCLQKKPEDRYSSFEDVITDLSDLTAFIEIPQTPSFAVHINDILNQVSHTDLTASKSSKPDIQDDSDELPMFDMNDDDVEMDDNLEDSKLFLPPVSEQETESEPEPELEPEPEQKRSEFVLPVQERKSGQYTLQSDDTEEEEDDDDDENDENDDSFIISDSDDIEPVNDDDLYAPHRSNAGQKLIIAFIVLALIAGVGYALHLHGFIHIPGLGAEQKQEQAVIHGSETDVPPESEEHAADNPPQPEPPEPEPIKLPDPAPPAAVASQIHIDRGIAIATMQKAQASLKEVKLEEVSNLMNVVKKKEKSLTKEDNALMTQINEKQERYQLLIDTAEKERRHQNCSKIDALIQPLQEDEQVMRELLSKQSKKCHDALNAPPLTV